MRGCWATWSEPQSWSLKVGGASCSQNRPSPPPLQPEDQGPLLEHLRVHPHDLTNGGMMTVPFVKCQGTQFRTETYHVCLLIFNAHIKSQVTTLTLQRIQAQRNTATNPKSTNQTHRCFKYDLFPKAGFLPLLPSRLKSIPCGTGTWGLSPTHGPQTHDNEKPRAACDRLGAQHAGKSSWERGLRHYTPNQELHDGPVPQAQVLLPGTEHVPMNF